jgi:hypothetical protein
MTSQRSDRPGTPDPMRAGAQPWEAGRQSLFDGQRQAQEFWNTMTRSWGEVTGAWLGQFSRSGKSIEVLRELQEAAFATAQAWMRLPLVLVGGAQPGELRDAVTRLTQAQGRAYQLWLEALKGTGARTPTSEAVKPADRQKPQPQDVGGKGPTGRGRRRQRTSSRP